MGATFTFYSIQKLKHDFGFIKLRPFYEKQRNRDGLKLQLVVRRFFFKLGYNQNVKLTFVGLLTHC